MWKLWLTGILGFSLIAINFMSLSIQELGLVLTLAGLGITILSVWSLLELEPEETDWSNQRKIVRKIDMMHHGHKS